MQILYFYQYFSTPRGSWGTRVYEFASEWVKAGHEVTVVTSIYSKSDIKAEKWIENQEFNGIKVKVINVKIDNKQSIPKRILSFLLYAMFSTWYALTLKADVVIASSGPITVGIPGLIARYLRGRKLVFETRDLWPEGAIELGMIKNPILKKLAYAFEARCYKASKLIVSLSPGMKEYIQLKHHHPNVISVTNAANIDLFSKPLAFPEEQQFLKSNKYAIYTGNIGEVNNSYWLLNAARILKDMGRDDLEIILIGEGQQREELQRIAEQESISNFSIHGLMPKEKLVPIIQHAIASLVPLKGTPVLDTSSPNKFFESLAAGTPVIQNTKGWMKSFLEEHELGYTLDPNNPEELAQTLINMDANPELRDSIGKKAMEVAAKEFDKTILADKMLNGLLAVNNN